MAFKKSKSEIIGVHENTDWFRYLPNDPKRDEGYQVEARWQDGVREFRHRRRSGGAWMEGSPWDQ
jgi:hypothetical protein